MDKKTYYTDENIVDGYISLRYKGYGGEYVHTRECSIACSLLPSTGRVLDLPVGTGRLRPFLKEKNLHSYGADFSEQMLHFSAKKYADLPLARADAFRLPFKDASFDAVVSLRFVFHYADPANFFKEVGRILVPGGAFVFDTYTWSPFMFPGTPMCLGGRSYIHLTNKLKTAAESAAMQIEKYQGAFLFSPLLYRYSPKPLVKLYEGLEKLVPEGFRNVRFWKLTKKIES